jgi:hypothetical protein
MGNIALSRITQAVLTNKSGGDLPQGAVVIMDLTTAASFTTTTTSGFVNGAVGVIVEPNGIANNASGMVAFSGPVPKINLSGSASLGDLFKTHTVAGQAVRHAAGIAAGDFGIVMGTGTTPAAYLWGMPAGATGAGSGDVVGPASAVDGNVSLFNGTTGKLIKDGGTPASLVLANMWTQVVNETGASFTNFTGTTGTWSSDGTVIKQTITDSTVRRARYNNVVNLIACIFEAEVYIHTANGIAGLLCGYDGTNSGGMAIKLNDSTNAIELDIEGTSIRKTASVAVVPDTWYKIRFMAAGTHAAFYFAGTLIGTAQAENAADLSYVGLLSQSAEAWFRNIKLWNLAMPA